MLILLIIGAPLYKDVCGISLSGFAEVLLSLSGLMQNPN